MVQFAIIQDRRCSLTKTHRHIEAYGRITYRRFRIEIACQWGLAFIVVLSSHGVFVVCRWGVVPAPLALICIQLKTALLDILIIRIISLMSIIIVITIRSIIIIITVRRITIQDNRRMPAKPGHLNPEPKGSQGGPGRWEEPPLALARREMPQPLGQSKSWDTSFQVGLYDNPAPLGLVLACPCWVLDFRVKRSGLRFDRSGVLSSSSMLDVLLALGLKVN